MKKYLVIQPKMIGDVLMSTLLCEHLKTNISNSEIHYLIHEHTRAVTDNNPNIDKLWVVSPGHKKSIARFVQFLSELRKERFDAVIDVYGKFESNLVSLAAKSDIKVAFKKSYSKFIYNRTVELWHEPRTNLGMVVENRLALLEPILQQLQNPRLLPKIHISREEKEQAELLLKKHHINLDQPIVMVGLMGSSPEKSYPLPYLGKLLDAVSAQFNTTFLLNYLPDQKDKVDELLKNCSERTRKMIREDVQLKSLRLFLTVLDQCSVYLGNEGGASNMARALGLPNFSIFSPWIPKKGWFTDFENPKNHAVHLDDYSICVRKLSKKEKKENIKSLYQGFEPELFKKELLEFLKREVFFDQ